MNGKRILIGTLRRGGIGLYAMDITSPNNPKFLWAIENILNMERNSDTYDINSKKIIRWGKAVNEKDYNTIYSFMGHLTQEVFIHQLSDTMNTGTSDYIGLLVSGNGYDLKNFSPKSVFAINPEDGEPFCTLYDGNWVSPLTFVSLDDDNEKLDGFFFADATGQVLYYEPPQSGVATDLTGWKRHTVFTLTTVSDSGIANGKPVAISKGILGLQEKNGTSLWLVGGSGNIKGLDIYKNRVISSTSTELNTISNAQQFIFSYKTSNPPTENSSITTTSLTKLTLDKFSDHEAELPVINKYGWYVLLRYADSSHEAEIMSTEPYLYANMVSVATFQEQKPEIDMVFCNKASDFPLKGTSYLYIFDPATGKPQIDALELPNVLVTGLQGLNKELLVIVQNLKENAVDELQSSDPRIRKFDDTSFTISMPLSASIEAPDPIGTVLGEFSRSFSFR